MLGYIEILGLSVFHLSSDRGVREEAQAAIMAIFGGPGCR